MKNYGTQPPLTDFERQTLTCREIQIEQARVQGFRAQLDGKWARIDARDLLAFDFGIGNHIAFSEAVDSADKRTQQLEAVAIEKGCAAAKPDHRAGPVKRSEGESTAAPTAAQK
ncbi:hypothetical protein HTY52_18155 [Cupriavidus taiwanensis]|uniref:hypothetical protein n=1 Tax=Cupriavidus taiwanensis TaxID=164546 RepID=UPI00157312FA|nr:hypothetical protein [Cupriavidus taiwanensis]NSX16011.1 hypothetical protein [Cupriavidus taiwanensis]